MVTQQNDQTVRLGSLFPNMTLVESDFSIFKFKKNIFNMTLIDFSL